VARAGATEPVENTAAKRALLGVDMQARGSRGPTRCRMMRRIQWRFQFE